MTDIAAFPALVLAKARTHTAESIGQPRAADDLRNNEALWLWVPGRARRARLPGTTGRVRDTGLVR
jgi:hypothetical protein